MATIQGHVSNESGNNIGDARIYVINDDDQSLVGTTMTDTNGDYSIAAPDNTTVHVVVQWDFGDDSYTDESKPFVTTPSTVTIIDSFEGDISGWDGDATGYSITDDHVTDGSWSLRKDDGLDTQIRSTSGLPAYFSKGEEMHVDLLTESSASEADGDFLRPHIQFGLTDSDSYYSLEILIDGGPHMILRSNVDGGGETTIDGNSQSLSEWDATTWYTVQIQRDDGATFGGSDNDINFEVVRRDNGTSIGSNSVNDSAHAPATGIGFEGAGDTDLHPTQTDYWRKP